MLYAKESFMKNLDERIIIQNEKNFEMRNIDMNYNLFIGYIKMILEFVAVLLLVLLIRNNIITVAIAIALYNYRNTVLTNFMDIVSELLEECKNFNISSDRVFSIVNNKEFKKEKFGKGEIENIDGNFEFKNVKFGYNENLVLKGLNLKIDSGKTYGIVGKSGSGKTTIFNLLNKLYNVNSGSISIDGKDINDLNEKSIRGSALDNETQSKIQKAIDNLKGDYTIIIIAHRLSTIVNCDKIFILEDGKISDSGTHEDLFNSNDYYQQLCRTELFEKNN